MILISNQEKGYFINTPARSYRYQVLLDFAMEREPEKADLYTELLTCDYYLRENAKSRPSFAADQTCYYREMADFYEKEEKEPEILTFLDDTDTIGEDTETTMEAFFYPVWENCPEKICERWEKPGFLLFDYEKRNPLTGDARTVLI